MNAMNVANVANVNMYDPPVVQLGAKPEFSHQARATTIEVHKH